MPALAPPKKERPAANAACRQATHPLFLLAPARRRAASRQPAYRRPASALTPAGHAPSPNRPCASRETAPLRTIGASPRFETPAPPPHSPLLGRIQPERQAHLIPAQQDLAGPAAGPPTRTTSAQTAPRFQHCPPRAAPAPAHGRRGAGAAPFPCTPASGAARPCTCCCTVLFATQELASCRRRRFKPGGPGDVLEDADLFTPADTTRCPAGREGGSGGQGVLPKMNETQKACKRSDLASCSVQLSRPKPYLGAYAIPMGMRGCGGQCLTIGPPLAEKQRTRLATK
ncbi:MAG: hypothetical protein J3K34DRAFT_223510 [Monoraphidium minutum]|nr:MAG: hypothetical protein J3K34DRAFT_223510 [Monoraphidium minutum]